MYWVFGILFSVISPAVYIKIYWVGDNRRIFYTLTSPHISDQSQNFLIIGSFTVMAYLKLTNEIIRQKITIIKKLSHQCKAKQNSSKYSRKINNTVEPVKRDW